ncbi:hypothetical protein HanXRQr2_Chr11g0509371 [Helianthus annuus]|uniref:Uncharacterized protein n=1 Tax=Helianthus annuus TaxID=4232 RepID=A0A9K3HRR8_HELAN|nr:hypothetical protein HanXRQr2_Chr11g0509371 [Helianthus annuus]
MPTKHTYIQYILISSTASCTTRVQKDQATMAAIEVAGDNLPSSTAATPWQHTDLISRLIIVSCVPMTNLGFIIYCKP